MNSNNKMIIDGGKDTNDMFKWWADMSFKLHSNEYKKRKVFIMTDENNEVVVLKGHKEAVKFADKMMNYYAHLHNSIFRASLSKEQREVLDEWEEGLKEQH